MMNLKRMSMAAFAICLCSMGSMAQTAKQILDKTAAAVSNPGGITAKFNITGKAFGNSSGTISVKGRQFHAATPQAIVWFNGKTQWTYVKSNEEVNVSNPTEAQLQAMNPYNFINMYKKGFKYTATTSGNCHQVHLTATDKKRNIQEMYITVNKTTYVPTQVKMRQGTKWNVINISNFKKANLSNDTFQFRAKDYPKAEVIDLR